MRKLITRLILATAIILPYKAYAITGQEISNTCGLATACGALIANISASSGTITPAADNTYDVGTSSAGFRSGYFDTSVLTPLIIPPAALTLRLAADAQRLVAFTGSSDTALVQSFGDGGTTAVQTYALRAGTADADDDATLCVSGSGSCTGGAANNARGGFVFLQGADVGGANTGYTEIGGTGRIDFFTGSAGTNALRIADTGNATFSGTVTSASVNTLGWTPVAGANTACTTTCTSACVFGIDSAAPQTWLPCSDATADMCLCAGAS